MLASINLAELASQISSCTTKHAILDSMHSFFSSIGVTYYNYTHLDFDLNTENKYIMHHNYPPHWVQQYIHHKYSEIDPAVFTAKINNTPFLWNEACKIIEESIKMSKEKRLLLHSMQKGVKHTGLENAIAIPIVFNVFKQYGFYLAFSNHINLSNSYLKILLPSACFMINNMMIEIEKSTLSTAHIKFTKHDKFPFTERETTLLKNLCNGKNREDIASIMNVSLNTIDTLLKRIYLRARVNSILQLMVIIQIRGWRRIIIAK